MIKYGCQSISDEDIMSVLNVLKSEFLTQGPIIKDFEKLLADTCGSKFALAVNSATSALHISYLALGLKSGDVIWTSPNTFVATANAALMCGAFVDFVDINKNTYNMCVETLEKKLINAKKKGKLPDIVVPVHFAGTACDMKQIYELSKIYGFKIVEDASHAIGATYEREEVSDPSYPVGSGKYSDLCIFSLHPVKIITSGEGGIITCNNNEIYEKMQLLRSHGVSRDSKHFQTDDLGPWDYEQVYLGYNYRMTELQAALGLSQLSKLDEFVERRFELVKRYERNLHDFCKIKLPRQPSSGRSSNHLFCVLLNSNIVKCKRQIYKDLTDQGIGVNVHYRPVPEQSYYKNRVTDQSTYQNALNYYHRTLTLPLHPGMNSGDVDFICTTLKSTILKYDHG